MRRPSGPHSLFVSSLLLHLAKVGFDGAPGTLGRDDQARDIFTWIEGEAPPDLAAHSDEVLAAAARLIRRYHDATVELVDAAEGVEVVCHNDLSPCNFVFRAGLPIAMIDFDAAAPGTRLYDLGYAVWLWLDLGNAEFTALEQSRRCQLFLDAYRLNFPPAEMVASVLDRQRQLASEGIRQGNAAMAEWADRCSFWVEKNLPLSFKRFTT